MSFNLKIQHQESYSRGELLLRTFFGFFYIVIPHAFMMWFVSIWAMILMFLAWWVVLFTGKYPENWWTFQKNFLNWQNRVNATMMNLVDGYPAFWPSGTSDKVEVVAEYPQTMSRGTLLLRTFFGYIYVLIPHAFCLIFRMWATYFVVFVAWWVVLFTGKYPEDMHRFNVGTLRWGLRVGAYMSFLTDTYPPFSGKE